MKYHAVRDRDAIVKLMVEQGVINTLMPTNGEATVSMFPDNRNPDPLGAGTYYIVDICSDKTEMLTIVIECDGIEEASKVFELYLTEKNNAGQLVNPRAEMIDIPDPQVN